MENKYYTPEIEEFHVGFECEITDVNACMEEFSKEREAKMWFDKIYTPKHVFKKHTITERDMSFYSLDPHFIEKDLRVKYLDKEDIEACEWKHDPNNDGEESPSLFEKHGYSLGFSIDQQMTPKDTCYILYLFPDQFVIIDSIYKCGSGREEMLFRGYIKNKSELKRLMKQLNIQL